MQQGITACGIETQFLLLQTTFAEKTLQQGITACGIETLKLALGEMNPDLHCCNRVLLLAVLKLIEFDFVVIIYIAPLQQGITACGIETNLSMLWFGFVKIFLPVATGYYRLRY